MTRQIIILETARHFVVRAPGNHKGFEIWRNGATAAVKCATIGFDGDEGMLRVRLELERREAAGLYSPIDRFAWGKVRPAK